MKETKWDALYDTQKKSLFSRLEEFVINAYFSNVFTKAILSVSNIKTGKIFEPGSGGGMTSVKFAKEGFDVTCMDLSENALQKTKSLFKHMALEAKFTLGDLFHTPIKNEQFNIVFNQGVMEHFRLANLDPSDGVKEMLRVCKEKGHLIIFDAVLPKSYLNKPIAWLIRKADRGKYMRNEKELLFIISNNSNIIYQQRITYSYTGLEAIIIIIKK